MTKTKLHLGNGTVYLDDYVNIDIVGELATERPDLVEHNKTTVDKYYKYPFRVNKDNFVTDIRADVRTLPMFKDGSVEEILCVNLIDHLKKEDFIVALQEWKRVLVENGKLIIDVDDRRKQSEVLTNATTIEEVEWAMKLIYCDHASEGRTHWWGYEPGYLKNILEKAGFKYVWTKRDYIVHDTYPNFQIFVTK